MNPSPQTVRILLVADSHLGFDHPSNPRIRRRRRGEDFLANHRRAFETALEERVDLVVHGGDLFHMPRVQPSLVHQAFAPMKAVADAGIGVFVVPGNHERSRIPFDWIARHPRIHVFREPGTIPVQTSAGTVAISGIPCMRRNARTRFKDELERTTWRTYPADLRLLILHQAFEGATVGPSDFTFRRGHDVLELADVPGGFAAVLTGHIHRHQVLQTDLKGRPIPAPVFYPGSVERTAFAERDEPKGFLMLEGATSDQGGSIRSWAFHDLHARPMRIRPLRVRGLGSEELERALAQALLAEPPDCVLRLEADGDPTPEAADVLSAARLRQLAPATMNVAVTIPGMRNWKGRRPARAATVEGPAQGSLFQ